MKGSLAALLRTLVLPFGVTTGQRIVIDGVNGRIEFYDSTNTRVGVLDTDGITWSAADGSIIDVDPTGTYGGAEIDITPPTVSGVTWVPGVILGVDFDATQKYPVLVLESPNATGKDFSEIHLIGEGQTDATDYIWLGGDKVTSFGGIHAIDPDPSTSYFAPEPWHTPTYGNNWTAGSGAALQYRKLVSPANSVQLCGSIHSPNPFVSVGVFTLPVGYRPAGTQYLLATRDTAVATQLKINTSGVVSLENNTTTGVDWFINGIFQVDK